MAAQRAAINLASQITASNTSRSEPTTATAIDSPDNNMAQSPETILSEGDGLFRKPTWPASARPASLAKPVLPPRQSQTLPIMSSSNNLAPSNVPKPRAPSPGLLKRMSSMESGSGSEGGPQRRESLEPKKLNLKKASVDDLRRLYEERVHTVKGLAGSLRKVSSAN
jgi:Rho GTPase-activating protein 1